MDKTIFKPIIIFIGICTTIALMSGTDVFNPLIKFIHSDPITPFGGLLCALFTAFGFWACYALLNAVCNYFVPRIESNDKHGSNHVDRVNQ